VSFRPLFVEVDVESIRDRERRQSRAFQDMLFRYFRSRLHMAGPLTDYDLAVIWARCVE
jgi:hypothetical protein